MIVFDTYAWVEYFAGSEKGSVVKSLIDSKEEIITPTISLAEIKNKTTFMLSKKKEQSANPSRMPLTKGTNRINKTNGVIYVN